MDWKKKKKDNYNGADDTKQTNKQYKICERGRETKKNNSQIETDS